MDDFGFTHSSFEEIAAKNDKSERILNLVIPFLEKLRGDETTDTIIWPGKERGKQITAFIKKIKEIK